MTRPRVSIYVGQSLDGFIAGPSGELDWLEGYGGEEAMAAFEAFMAGVDAILMGRRTWEVVRGFSPWPYAGKRMVVLTHRPLDGAAHGEEAVEGGLDAVLERLGAEGVRHVYVDGGDTARQALAIDAVDALTLAWVPVTLGRGRPLFGTEGAAGRWARAEVRPWPCGIVQVRYLRVPPE